MFMFMSMFMFMFGTPWTAETPTNPPGNPHLAESPRDFGQLGDQARQGGNPSSFLGGKKDFWDCAEKFLAHMGANCFPNE